MVNHARGDSKTVAYSSEDDEGYRARISTTTIQRMSQLNFRDANYNFMKVFEQQPALISGIFDETDRQFWAEDELSSSESKIKLSEKRKKRRSVAYRNRVKIRRNRSVLFQSSSSQSGSTYLKLSTANNFSHRPKRSRYYREIRKKAKLQSEIICLVQNNHGTLK